MLFIFFYLFIETQLNKFKQYIINITDKNKNKNKINEIIIC